MDEVLPTLLTAGALLVLLVLLGLARRPLRRFRRVTNAMRADVSARVTSLRAEAGRGGGPRPR